MHSRSATENAGLNFVTQPPETIVGKVGEQLTLECAANAQPNVTVRYINAVQFQFTLRLQMKWLKDQKPLEKDTRIRVIGQSTLVIDELQAVDRAIYTCRAINEHDEEQRDVHCSLDVLGRLSHA